MPIDVPNHMWVGVFSASYARQYHDWEADTFRPPTPTETIVLAERAVTIADEALNAYRRMNERANRDTAGDPR